MTSIKVMEEKQKSLKKEAARMEAAVKSSAKYISLEAKEKKLDKQSDKANAKMTKARREVYSIFVVNDRRPEYSKVNGHNLTPACEYVMQKNLRLSFLRKEEIENVVIRMITKELEENVEYQNAKKEYDRIDKLQEDVQEQKNKMEEAYDDLHNKAYELLRRIENAQRERRWAKAQAEEDKKEAQERENSVNKKRDLERKKANSQEISDTLRNEVHRIGPAVEL